jgi:hypothetical protein
MPNVDLVVIIETAHVNKTESIAAQIRALGITVRQVLSLGGAVTVTASPTDIAILQAIPGVASVRNETTMQIPPGGGQPSR